MSWALSHVQPGRERVMRFVVSTLSALALALACVSPAGAWTLLRNNFDDTQSPNYPDVHGDPASCTDTYDPGEDVTWWCVTWPLANGHSSTVHVYLMDSLDDNQSGETMNMKTQAGNAFNRWNAVPAYEPYLVESSTLSNATGWLAYNCATRIERGALPAFAIAGTSEKTEYQRLGYGSQHKLVCFWTTISDGYRFDTDTDPDDGFVDIRWAMTHELGHGLGLGHTSHHAVMYPLWPNDEYMGNAPTSDDINGLQFAYGQP
jgi:hypothetical protein